eukprot:5583242-Pyramimonas_sp.AAC.1
MAREKISRASRARGPAPREFSPGQWVYVWRRMTRSSSRADALGRRRDGWCGPGAVVLAQGGTVWVAVRARLWKCSAEQL